MCALQVLGLSACCWLFLNGVNLCATQVSSVCHTPKPPTTHYVSSSKQVCLLWSPLHSQAGTQRTQRGCLRVVCGCTCPSSASHTNTTNVWPVQRLAAVAMHSITDATEPLSHYCLHTCTVCSTMCARRSLRVVHTASSTSTRPQATAAKAASSQQHRTQASCSKPKEDHQQPAGRMHCPRIRQHASCKLAG